MLGKLPIQTKNSPFFQCLHMSRNTGLVTGALQQKSKYNLKQIPIMHKTVAYSNLV